ncbi:MAG: aminotransferase class I/II-fold pyridoxal phosphate-dependent enzyme, partial [Acidobacteria bacterium]|nr:aminotransferase class I/II-fold pyridoxal phosphate-dependent enzyme [Acidobacteriota bacterium]
CFASGLAVVQAVLQGLEPGDHVLLADDLYYDMRKTIADVFGQWPLEFSYADMTDLDAVRAAVRPSTRLLWTESPSNPLMKVVDLAALAEIARAAEAISICDSTFAPPVIERPLEQGIDMVMHSTTKYIGGHSDVMGGSLATRYDNYLFERVRKSQGYGGAVPSPFDCWLLLRSIETLVVRVRAAQESAGRIAAWLTADSRVEAVHYPGLAQHPRHSIAARQMPGGFGGMLSVQIRSTREQAKAAPNHTKIFIRATSLDGTHSLIEHRQSVEGHASKTPPNLLRLSIGLERADDLIADLDQAIAKATAT